MQLLQQLYARHFGSEPVTTTPLQGAGSNRQYYRLFDNEGHTVIGVVGTMPSSIWPDISVNGSCLYPGCSP